MRILSVIASLAESGGAEMLVRTLSLDYARRGHDCHIVYIADADTLGASRDYERAFMEEMDRAGIGYTMLGPEVRRNILLGGWRLRRATRAFPPDLIHMHLGYSLLFQAAGLLRMPTIYTHHNVIFKFSTRLFRLFDLFVDRYIAICHACQLLLEPYVGKPIVLIHNGVRDGFSKGRPRTALPRNIEVLSVGNLTPQKDYATLIDAAAVLVPRLQRDGRRIRFAIAGEGDERERLATLIEERGLQNHVRLLGARSDVSSLMSAADVLVMTSAFEGLSITLIEGAMSALPIVATDVGGSAEIVVNGTTGLLVPPGNVLAVSDAVYDLLSNEARYCSFSAAAQARSCQFDLCACAEAHLALYAEIISEGHAGHFAKQGTR